MSKTIRLSLTGRLFIGIIWIIGLVFLTFGDPWGMSVQELILAFIVLIFLMFGIGFNEKWEIKEGE